MIDDKGLRNYRKLLYYKEKHLSIHFSLETKKEWCNGNIIDLDKEKLILVLNEFKKGQMIVLFEDIKEDSIKPFVSKEKI